MEFIWENDFVIKVSVDGNTTIVSANKAGLTSLAKNLTLLADELSGSHIHLDDYNSLEEGSSELIIEKI